MKTNFALIAGALSSTAISAVSAKNHDWITVHDKFSLRTLQKITDKIRHHKYINEDYNKEMKGSGCPPLKTAEISLLYAQGENGRYRYMSETTSKATWWSHPMNTTRDLNQIEYYFVVEGGKCGIVEVFKQEGRATIPYEFWMSPREIVGCKGCKPIPESYLDGFMDADDALEKGVVAYEPLEKGFHEMKFFWDGEKQQPTYVFAGLDMEAKRRPSGENPWTFSLYRNSQVYVHVGAEDGEVEVTGPGAKQN